MRRERDPDRDMLAGALRGEAAATADLLRAAADIVWTACIHVTRDRAETEAAFRDVMAVLSADRFARLEGYDGRASLRTYLALVVRDLLGERVIRLLAIDADRGWRAFEAFFADDIRRIILGMLPGRDHQQNREDAYQAVCEALLRNGRERLRAYSGRGSPSGFILHVVENLVIDHVRTIIPRRRLPAAIRRLPELDQAVFRLIYWEEVAPEPAILVAHLVRTESTVTVGAIVEAVERVRAALPPHYDAHGQVRTVDVAAADAAVPGGDAGEFAVVTPEENLAAAQEAALLEGALAALQRALPGLAAVERLYLQCALAGQPARDIARLLGVPPEDVHKLAQKVKRRLREEIGAEEAVRKWRLSV